jgi:hypothetical protein
MKKSRTPLAARREFGYDALLIAPLFTGSFFFVNRPLALLVFSLASFAPLCASAATVAASAIPDGTYTVKVEKVVDAKHVQVVMDNGTETTLPAGRPNVDFSKLQPNDQMKLSLIGGSVMVYLDLTSH